MSSFQNETVGIIFQEIRKAHEATYTKVMFEIGLRTPYPISVLYSSPSSLGWSGRNQNYPRNRWEDISSAMQLLKRIGNVHFKKALTTYGENITPAWEILRWVVDFGCLGEEPIEKMHTLLQRVEAVIQLLDSPFKTKEGGNQEKTVESLAFP